MNIKKKQKNYLSPNKSRKKIKKKKKKYFKNEKMSFKIIN